MADKKIKIDVDIETSAKKAMGVSEKVFAGVAPTDDTSKQRLTKYANLRQSIQSKLDKGILDAAEFKQLTNELKLLNELTTKTALTMGKFTKEIKDQYTVVEKAQKALEKQRAKRNELRNKATISGGAVTSIKSPELTEELGQASIARVKGGKAFKNMPSFVRAYETEVVKAGKSAKDVFKNPEAAEKIYNEYSTQLQKAKDEFKLANEEVNKFTAQLKEAEEKLQDLLSKNTGEGSELFQEASGVSTDVNKAIARQQDAMAEEQSKQNALDEAKDLNIQLEKQQSLLGKAFKQFTLYSIALRTLKKALHEAVVTVRELDKSLTEQAMVTGISKQRTQELLKSYQELAIATGSTTKEVASVATEYLRQGKSTAEALKLTEAAISAARVAGISTAESVNYLTTALNGFRLSTEQAMRVSDKFAAVAASAATSYDEIATALSKVASQANLAGMSIDYTTALLTKGLETTREAPETIGTALKTIIARMRELTDYGETLEGDTDLNNVETQLSYIGIALRDTNGELRSTESVLDDLGQKWATLNSNQQAAVAKALAGTRQQSRLIAMMDDYERVIELQQISARSQGATLAQMETYLTGIEANLNNISVAWEQIITNIVDSDIINGLLNTISTVLEVVGETLADEKAMAVATAAVFYMGLNVLANKKLQNDAAKAQLKLQRDTQLEQLQQFINAKNNI